MRLVLSLLLALIGFAPPAQSHVLLPAYLEIRQTGTETFDVLWKVPGTNDKLRIGLAVELPDGAVNLTAPLTSVEGNASITRWKFQRPDGIAGTTITIGGLQATVVNVLVRLVSLDGAVQTIRLSPSDPAFQVEADPSGWEVVGTYTLLGVEHILKGVDHLLFVLALLILVQGTARLLTTITAFTLAHSITLAGATLGYVSIPGPPVEAMIALSIVFVASEILRGHAGHPGLTARYPWVVSFTFGLLHGFGFAAALSSVGLPGSAIPVALLFFNVGVELGQLIFVTGVFATIGAFRALRLPLPAWSVKLPPYLIGTMAMFWVIQRLSLF